MSERHGIIYETFIKEDITRRRYQYDDAVCSRMLLWKWNGICSYANANKIKTTAAADTLEEFKITDFQASDGTFQYKDLGWLSSYQDLEKEIAMPIGTTTAFTEGETMGDINYSVKLLNYISVGMQPVYNAEGGLTTLTVYFEDTYTAEQLDDLFDKAVAAAREAFGDEDKYQENDQDGGKGTVYHTTVHSGTMRQISMVIIQ